MDRTKWGEDNLDLGATTPIVYFTIVPSLYLCEFYKDLPKCTPPCESPHPHVEPELYDHIIGGSGCSYFYSDSLETIIKFVEDFNKCTKIEELDNIYNLYADLRHRNS